MTGDLFLITRSVIFKHKIEASSKFWMKFVLLLIKHVVHEVLLSVCVCIERERLCDQITNDILAMISWVDKRKCYLAIWDYQSDRLLNLAVPCGTARSYLKGKKKEHKTFFFILWGIFLFGFISRSVFFIYIYIIIISHDYKTRPINCRLWYSFVPNRNKILILETKEINQIFFL